MGLENLPKKVKNGFVLAIVVSFGLAETIQAQSTDKLFFEIAIYHGDSQIYLS